VRAVLAAPVALLAAVATAVAALASLRDSPRGKGVASTLAVFLLAALGTRWVAPSPMHAAVAAALLAVVGAIGAGALSLAGRANLLAAALGGVAFGLAAGLPVSIGTEAAGTLLLGAVLLASALVVGLQLQRRWHAHLAMRLAPRVLGAWACAIGLLLMALALWGRSA
jgi:hypothetical protein